MISIQANRFTGRRVSRAATGCRRALALFLCFFAWAPGVLTAAEDATRQQMQGLDEQVQEIKADVLGIAAELSLLEERLLYPSNTQVAVFVELKDPDFRLDAVQVRINGELVAHYIYSFKELEALRAGGVQPSAPVRATASPNTSSRSASPGNSPVAGTTAPRRPSASARKSSPGSSA